MPQKRAFPPPPLPGLWYLRVTARATETVEAGLQDLVPGEDHGLRVIQQPGHDPGEGMETSKVPAVCRLPSPLMQGCPNRPLTSVRSAAEFCWTLGRPESSATGGRAGSPAGGASGGASQGPLGRPLGTAPAPSPGGSLQTGPPPGIGSGIRGTHPGPGHQGLPVLLPGHMGGKKRV